MASIIHPRLLAALQMNFYPSACTVQVATETQNDAGEVLMAWADFAGHVNLPCRIAPVGGREMKRPDMTYTVGSHSIGLAGWYSTIVPKMRAVVSGVNYDILAVEIDGQMAATWLRVQVVA